MSAKIKSLFLIIMILLFMGFHVSNVSAKKLTLSEQGILLLDEYSPFYPDMKSTILEKRHIEGVGVEFDIYLPGNEHPENLLLYIFSKEKVKDIFEGVDIASCDAFELKFTLVAVDGSASEDNTGSLVVGAQIEGAFRPEVISLSASRPHTAISTTPMDANNISIAGFTAYMVNKEGWDPNGTTITLLVEPVLQDTIAAPLVKAEEKSKTAGRIIYVDSSATGANNGLTWSDAFKHLQDGLEFASEGDEIWVSDGIYKPDQGANKKKGDKALAFVLEKGVAIYGGFPPGGESFEKRRPAGNTILSGDLQDNDADRIEPKQLFNDKTRNDNSHHVISASGTNYETILDGFVITGGNAKGPSESSFHKGGGLYCKSGSLTLSNCVLKSNSGIQGGAVCILEGNPLMFNCIFGENYSVDQGGAVYSSKGSQLMYNCVFASNYATEKGGGLYNEYNSPIITNCTFSRNYAYSGGGIYCEKSTPIVKNCILWDNSSRYGKLEPSQIYAVEATVEYSCIQGLTESLQAKHNINLDPGFGDAENNNFTLKEKSPCIDAGINESMPEELHTDVDGTARLKDGNNDGVIQIDMGAQEF